MLENMASLSISCPVYWRALREFSERKVNCRYTLYRPTRHKIIVDGIGKTVEASITGSRVRSLRHLDIIASKGRQEMG